MDPTLEIRDKLAGEWIPAIYRDKVRSQRTRSYRMEIPEKENRADVQHTLLGVELKVGKIRLACPDLSTARFLLVFARIGCRDVALPYDITEDTGPGRRDRIRLAENLLYLEESAGAKSPQVKGKMRSALIRRIRDEISEIGAGEMMPSFDKPGKVH